MRALILAVLLTVGLHVHGGELPYWATSDANGKRFRSAVSDTALAKAPMWTQQMKRPPLSPGRARELACRQLQQTADDAKQWDLSEIALIDTGDHLHWLYVVRFTFHIPKDFEYIGGAQFFNIVVLMDGTAIKPELVPIAK